MAVASFIKNPTLLFNYTFCIYYLICFKKNQANVQALLNFYSEINVITPAYVAKLGPKSWCINIGAQKINSFILEIFRIILASFQIENKLQRARFFHEYFFIANINVAIILSIPFLIHSNTNVFFAK